MTDAALCITSIDDLYNHAQNVLMSPKIQTSKDGEQLRKMTSKCQKEPMTLQRSIWRVLFP